MSRNSLNRWLKPLAWLLMIVLIVMLLIPAELTDEQLAQIKPGMTMAEVHHMIGKPNVREGWSVVSVGDPGSKAEEALVAMWFQTERWLQPRVETIIPAKTSIKMSTLQHISFWVGKSKMLWVENDQDKVLNVWVMPITKTGAGLQGFINTFREYWSKWWK